MSDKVLLHLYVDKELRDKAKTNLGNISKFVNDKLRDEMKIHDSKNVLIYKREQMKKMLEDVDNQIKAQEEAENEIENARKEELAKLQEEDFKTKDEFNRYKEWILSVCSEDDIKEISVEDQHKIWLVHDMIVKKFELQKPYYKYGLGLNALKENFARLKSEQSEEH